jgi:Ca2+-binding RTX toxin-like protein
MNLKNNQTQRHHKSFNNQGNGMCLGDGNDFLSGGAGIDTLSGGDNNDYLYDQGGSDKTTLKGDGGNDILQVQGGSGITVLDGGAGNDILKGGAGSNSLDGGDGNDVITGGEYYDIINGGEGADAIEAGGGADLINGGAGADYLKGGAGDDQYIYDSANFGTDLIEDSSGTLAGKTGGAYDEKALAYVGGGYEYRKYTMGTMTLLGIKPLGDGKNTGRVYYLTRSCSRHILKGCRPTRHIELLKTACKASRHHCTA